MRIWDIAMTAARYVIRGRGRTLLTVAAVAIGVCAVVLIKTLGDSGKELIQSELEQLGINGMTVYETGNVSTLQVSDAKSIENSIEEISAAMPVVVEYSSYKLRNSSDQAVIWGIDNELSDILDIELSYGRVPTALEVRKKARVALIEEKLAQTIYKRDNVVGKELSLYIGGTWENFEIIGVIKSKNTNISYLIDGVIPAFVYIPYTAMNELLGKERVDQIAISCSPSAQAGDVENRVYTLLQTLHRGTGATYEIQDIGGYKSQVNSILELVTLFLNAVAFISLCVAGLGIMNIMLATMRERRREIGVCMAIGARQRDITLSFLMEAVIVSGVGGVLGVVLGLSLSIAATVLLNINLVIHIGFILITELVALLFGLFFGVAPAIRASKLDPIIALRE